MGAREYQSNAVSSAIAAADMFGEKNIVIEAPTGSGKSWIIKELCEQLEGNVVVMVNISPLIDQISEHLYLSGEDFSILKAGMEDQYDENHRIQLVMSQTFHARYEKLNIQCDYLIIDERHREYDTERTMNLVRQLKPKAIIGLTATPYDQDGCALENAYSIETISVKDLTEQGFLSPVKYFVPKWSTQMGLEDLRMSGSDYSGSAIDEKFNNNEYASNVIRAMNQIDAKNKKTLVFCNSIDQCELITGALVSDGFNAEAVHSQKSKNNNETILDMFKQNNGCNCLVSVSKLNIGFDVRDVDLGVMLRPTKVRSLYIQTVGRLTRTAEGKSGAEFLDLAGTVMEHGFHDEIYSPPKKGDHREKKEAKNRAAAEELKHIVSEEPTEVDREKIDVFIRELRKKEESIPTMDMKSLMALYDMSDNVYQIVHIAHRINELKSGTTYKESTVKWIADNWEMNFILYPEYQRRWLKAIKTRAKNIVRDGKKLSSLYYFIDFLIEKKDEMNY